MARLWTSPLHAAAEPLAMQIVLPTKALLEALGSTSTRCRNRPGRPSTTAAKDAGGDVPLLGRLVWSDADLGWVADWRIAFEGKTYDWQVRGVSFDEAFRVAMRGAAQVLSGNGQPE